MKDVFLIFEGGGAKCIAHIGALKALERKGVRIRGVAGTSAGAMIAALVAAGYRSEELFSVEGQTAGVSPVLRSVGLWGARDLFRRRDLIALTLVIRPLAAMGRWAAIVIAGLVVIGFAAAGYWARTCLTCGIAAFLIEIVLLLLALHRLLSGLASLDRLRNKLDEALRLRLGLMDGPQRSATFRDLRQRGRPLRIVATNVDRGTLRLFSDKTTPDMAIADAVTASMAVPLVFKPRRIDGHRHVDGALVSNLPAWTFDEERQLFPDTATIAFEIADPRSIGEAPGGNGVPSLLAGIARSTLFGATVLERRATAHLQGIALQTAVGLLDFDLSRPHVARAIRNAQAFTEAELDFRLVDLPRHYRQACKDIHDGVHTLLAHSPRVGDCPLPLHERIIRVNIAFQEAGSLDSLRIHHGYGMDGYADNDLLLPIAGSQAGDVYVSQVARVFAVQPDGGHHWLDGDENRHRRQLLWPGMRWIFAIPISVYDSGRAPDELRPAVLHIDSNVPVEYFDLELTEDQWNWYGRRFGDVIELVDHALRQLPYDRAPGTGHMAIPDREITLDGIVPATRPTARGKVVLAAADAYAAASERRLAADIEATLDRRAAAIERIQGDEASKRWLRRR
ncbi:patatin-like phospholipase family protein [Vineibacter terrae]|uniref:patatin-like phospholipase family protein n=1 Tax=Vineibacter terrae TaxID=2586908 RepID=UPI002E302A3E|nr:patatin-like phospholipase family protein [Vineibacter terrae]HEX2888278.1 patatin-like phospholipase family protein [Vineibacter terrae]